MAENKTWSEKEPPMVEQTAPPAMTPREEWNEKLGALSAIYADAKRRVAEAEAACNAASRAVADHLFTMPQEVK